MEKQMTYKGSLSKEEQTTVWMHQGAGLSGREIAAVTGLSYGKVRGYIEYHRDSLDDLIPPPMDGPRILIFDVETTPLLGWTWGKWKQNVMRIDQNWYMLCAAYKWLGDKETGFFGIYNDPNFHPNSTDDSYVAKRLHKLFNQADIIIGHNGDRFDIKKANSLFRKHGLGPTTHYLTIDTLKVLRKYFGEPSNSLKDIAKEWGLTDKAETGGLQLWFDCMAGVEAGWTKMRTYNVQDVGTLEELYLEVRPYMVQHPNVGFWADGEEPVCPKCGSWHITFRGNRKTKVSEFQTFQCDACLGYGRMRFRDSEATQVKTV